MLNQLPPGSQQPVLTVKIGQTIDAMYIGFSSTVLQPNQITDYMVRVVQPKLQAVEGVQTAELLGAKNFALRAWLDPEKLAAFGLTAADVATQLSNNDYISAVGNLTTFSIDPVTGTLTVVSRTTTGSVVSGANG